MNSVSGSWTAPQIGTLPVQGGGEISWTLDVGRSPIAAVGTVSGQDTITVPLLGSITVAVSGTFDLTLPIQP